MLALLVPALLADDPPPQDAAQPIAVDVPEQTSMPDVGHASKRLFGFLPNYRAADNPQTYSHPSVNEKFKIAWQNTFDWPNYITNAGYALQNQVSQQGFHGTGFGVTFAEYYGRAFADSFIGNFTTQAFLPSLLGEDPRYYRAGVGSGWSRTFRAIRQVAVTRGTNGKKRVNLSELAGNVGVVAVTSLYYPDQAHGMGPSAERWALAIGNDAIANLLTEFLPDLQRKLKRHHP